jgi:hypothetical protein
MTDIEDELETIGKGVDNVSAAHVSGTEYRVLSARNGSVTAYTVDIDDLSCLCEDMNHNTGQHEVCAHLAKALLCHTEYKRPKDWATQDLSMVAERANSLIHDLRDAEDYLATEIETSATMAAKEEAENGDAPQTPDEHAGDTPTAQDKAQELQEAFDSVIEDMVVEVSGGMIFFKTGYNTPEDWPYPGFQSTFEAITSPDPCLFVHDGSPDWADSPHELYDLKPDEFMKNAVDPDDVDDYLESLAI